MYIEFGTGKRKEKRYTSTSWNRLRRQIKNRDGSICYYCGEESPSGDLDHIIPLSRGGDDSPSNLTWSCSECNQSKGDKTPLEWLYPHEADNAYFPSFIQELFEPIIGVPAPDMTHADWLDYAQWVTRQNFIVRTLRRILYGETPVALRYRLPTLDEIELVTATYQTVTIPKAEEQIQLEG